MKLNVVEGIKRLYLVIWAASVLLGLVSLVTKFSIENLVSVFITAGVVPTFIWFAAKWVYSGMLNSK